MARPGKRASGNCPSPASLPSRTSSSSPKPTRAMDITPPASPSSIEQTAKHLREAGFREDTVAMSSTEQATFCACAAPESEFDIEEAIKCFNRNCEIQYFHLRCMKIPDHPPRGIGWVCPTCRRNKGSDRRTGLYDLRHSSNGMAWREWLQEWQSEKDILAPGGEISRRLESPGAAEEVVRPVERASTLLPGTLLGWKRKREMESESEADSSSSLASEDLPRTPQDSAMDSATGNSEAGMISPVELVPEAMVEEASEAASSASSELTEFESEGE